MRSTTVLFVVLITLTCTNLSFGQLIFNFDFASGTPINVQNGVIEAADLWRAKLKDPVTINVNVDYANTNPVLAETAPTPGNESYSIFKDRLLSDATSVADMSAYNSLQSGTTFDTLMNYTSDNPNGDGSPTPYVATRDMVQVTTANAKALGILPGDWMVVPDASISFNPNPDGSVWDFDRSNGIASGQYDFVGAAAHELGHVLGFYSQVDAIDQEGFLKSLLPDLFDVRTADEYTAVSLDMFRYSAASLAQGAGIEDMTAGMGEKFFSIDGGVTSLANFSSGTFLGDGRQAGHWQGSSFGLMGPQAVPGVQLPDISFADLTAMDVIGWDLVAVPEPNMVSILFLGLLGVATNRRRR